MTNPTRDALEAATKVLVKAALLDPRMSAGDEGTIVAWAEVIAPVSSQLGDMLDAVRIHYANSTERIMPADVLRHARAAQRDRLDRSDLDSPDRLALEAKADAKALPDELVEARRIALAEAAAKIGNTHDVDTRATFTTAPKPAKAESDETRAAKVARVRAAAPPTPMTDEETNA